MVAGLIDIALLLGKFTLELLTESPIPELTAASMALD
jgi:hypothetical protein